MTDGAEYCPKCGQSRSTHDDGECESVIRSMILPALRLENCAHRVGGLIR